eukprot:146491-Amphidinium_carterae.1
MCQLDLSLLFQRIVKHKNINRSCELFSEAVKKLSGFHEVVRKSLRSVSRKKSFWRLYPNLVEASDGISGSNGAHATTRTDAPTMRTEPLLLDGGPLQHASTSLGGWAHRTTKKTRRSRGDHSAGQWPLQLCRSAFGEPSHSTDCNPATPLLQECPLRSVSFPPLKRGTTSTENIGRLSFAFASARYSFHQE